jgi:uncharacterized protein (TIGR00730 family)
MNDPKKQGPDAPAAQPAAEAPSHEWGAVPRYPYDRHLTHGRNGILHERRRAFRIFREFIRGYRAFHSIGPCATVFGSARFQQDHRYYQLALETGRRLARAGFVVMTGGGPGVMEAANRGAQAMGGLSVGCNIELPQEEQHNPYLDHWVEFRYFFVRKVMLIKYSYAFFGMPGGFGTMDEIFEVATLIQTGKIDSFPCILMGTDYWQPLVDFIQESMLAEGTISADENLPILLTDDFDEAIDFAVRGAEETLGAGKLKAL